MTTETTTTGSSCWNLKVSAEADRGGRKYMEDVALVDFRREQNIEYAVFGIFDGHGGHQAARFAKAHLMNFIRQQKCFWSNRSDSVKKAIHDGFIACHEAMRKKLPNWPKTALGHDCTSGSTASIAIIRGNKLYVAYVGDSGIVMGFQKTGDQTPDTEEKNQNLDLESEGTTEGTISLANNPHTTFCEKLSGPAYSSNCNPSNRTKTNKDFYYRELTTDHKPESLSEKRRIIADGGGVAIKNGVNRVIWKREKFSGVGYDRIPFLAVARSLGDLWSYNPDTDRFVVSPVPDIEVVDLNAVREKPRFIILASDGIWNMIRPWDAVYLVSSFKQRRQNGKTDGSPAHDLVREALMRWRLRGLRADNSSAVVIWLDKAEGKTSSEYFNKAWSSDTGNSVSYTNPTETSVENQKPEILEDEDEDDEEISISAVELADVVPAKYPSMSRMGKYADLSIPEDELALISDDSDVNIEEEAQVKTTSSSKRKNSSESSPLQDNAVSSTSDVQKNTDLNKSIKRPSSEREEDEPKRSPKRQKPDEVTSLGRRGSLRSNQKRLKEIKSRENSPMKKNLRSSKKI